MLRARVQLFHGHCRSAYHEWQHLTQEAVCFRGFRGFYRGVNCGFWIPNGRRCLLNVPPCFPTLSFALPPHLHQILLEICRGTVEAWDPKASDMLLIRGALQNESLTFLKKRTEEKYHVYRAKQIAEEIRQRRVWFKRNPQVLSLRFSGSFSCLLLNAISPKRDCS